MLLWVDLRPQRCAARQPVQAARLVAQGAGDDDNPIKRRHRVFSRQPGDTASHRQADEVQLVRVAAEHLGHAGPGNAGELGYHGQALRRPADAVPIDTGKDLTRVYNRRGTSWSSTISERAKIGEPAGSSNSAAQRCAFCPPIRRI